VFFSIFGKTIFLGRTKENWNVSFLGILFHSLRSEFSSMGLSHSQSSTPFQTRIARYKKGQFDKKNSLKKDKFSEMKKGQKGQ
jgi:hypothetical protein